MHAGRFYDPPEPEGFTSDQNCGSGIEDGAESRCAVNVLAMSHFLQNNNEKIPAQGTQQRRQCLGHSIHTLASQRPDMNR